MIKIKKIPIFIPLLADFKALCCRRALSLSSSSGFLVRGQTAKPEITKTNIKADSRAFTLKYPKHEIKTRFSGFLPCCQNADVKAFRVFTSARAVVSLDNKSRKLFEYLTKISE